MSLLKRIQDGWGGEFAAEAIFFGFKVAEAMLDPSVRLYIYQTVCKEEFPVDASCYTLQESPERENHVQDIAASYTIAYKILLNAPVVILALFCGAWSDHIGRKLPVVLACLGSIFAVLLFMLSIMESVPTMTLVLTGSMLRGMFGKSAVVTMALHSYITDITSKEQRTRRFGTLLGMNFFGYFAGSLLAGLILEWSSFDVIFCVVIIIYALCVFIALVCMRESLSEHAQNVSNSVPPFRNPFNMKHIKESLSVAIRPRKDHERLYLWFFFLCIIAHQTCKSGEVDTLLLFTKRSPLNWSKSLYGYFLATDYAMLGISVIFLLPILVNYCKMKDVTLLNLGLIFKIIRLLILTFSSDTIVIFFSVIVSCPSALVASGVKSMVSKTVEEDEIGKVFSLLSCMETMSNLAGSVIFNSVYAATASTIFPGFTFLMDSIFQFLLLVIVIAVTLDMKSCTRYSILEETAAETKLYGSTKEVVCSSNIHSVLHVLKEKEKCPMSFDNEAFDKSLEECPHSDKYKMFKQESDNMTSIREESIDKTDMHDESITDTEQLADEGNTKQPDMKIQ